jgi:tetratricopeptide (TPR) repeat protein
MKALLIVFVLIPFLVISQNSFDKGEKLFKEGKFDQASPFFESFLKSNPSNLKTLEYLGDIAGYNKSWDKAIIYYKKLKSLKPSEANYYYKYGGVLGMKAKESNKIKALGMIGEVKNSFEKTIKLNAKHVEARWALIELYLQLPAIVGGSEEKAIQYSDELKEISPVDGHLSKGHINEYFKRHKEAELEYKRAIIVGGSKVCYEALSNLYKNKMKEPAKAKVILEQYKKKSNQ